MSDSDETIVEKAPKSEGIKGRHLNLAVSKEQDKLIKLHLQKIFRNKLYHRKL